MTRSYDVIIVGAGSAGCVLAEQLSADPNVSVLLLEAGPSAWNPLIWLPVGARKLFQHNLFQWRDRSEPEPFAGNQTMAVPHGKVVGGTGAINFMAWVHGTEDDFDRWQHKGAIGWSHAVMKKYYTKLEAWKGRADPRRGQFGAIEVEAPATIDPIQQAWAAAGRELGMHDNPDYNAGQQLGVSPIQYSAHRARRSNSASTFLKRARRRPNLTCITGAHVLRVVMEGTRATGVVYQKRGRQVTVAARDRVVLSQGAINTPHTLMLSGIGPSAHLSDMGIQPIIDLPVGQGLEDHLAFAMIWKRPAPDPFFLKLRFDKAGINFLRALVLRSGLLSAMPGGAFVFAKVGPERPRTDLQFVISNLSAEVDVWWPWKKPKAGSFVIKVNLMSQQSRGSLQLRSADPMVRPSIRYNALSAAADREVMREGYRLAEVFGESRALAPFRVQRITPAEPLTSDAEIDAFVARTAQEQYHPACTCAIGRVLEPDFAVKGCQGLYVVDASAMPELISGNPNATVMAMALRAADLWKLGAADR